MKEFTYKLKQILRGTRVLSNNVKHQILCFGCLSIHFLFFIMMLVGKVYVLSGVHLLATIFYAYLGLVLSNKEKYRVLFLLAFVEIELNASFSSIALGQGYGFVIYTLALIPGAFYLAHTWPAKNKNKYGISIIPIVTTLVVGFTYLAVEVLYEIIPPIFDSETITKLRPFFHYFNILVAVVLLLAFSIMFALEVRYVQKLLYDENSRLGEIAARDPLTKALNRRSLYDIINKEIEENEQTQFGIIILDIDDFKLVNDTYGHDVGDRVLIGVSNILKDSLRDSDYFCRWGGEEFLLFIHGADDEYSIVAERIRSGIEKQVFTAGAKEFSITATLGISVYQTGLKLRTLVDMADQKMYFGKNHGKNQIVQ